MRPRLGLPSGIDRQAFSLYLMNFLVNLGVGIMAPVLPQLKTEFSLSYGEVGFIVSAFGLSRVILDLPVGWASERFKPMAILLLGTLLLTIGSFSASLSPSYALLVASRAIMGAGSAMCTTTALIILSHLSTPQNRARVMSLYPVGAFAGVSFSPLIGGYLAAIFDWRSSFYFCGFSVFLSMVFVLITQHKRREKDATQETNAKRLHHRSESTATNTTETLSGRAASRALIAINVATFTVYFSRQGMLQALVPLYAGNVLAVNVEVIGMLLSGSAIITMVILTLGGVIADRYGRMVVFVPGICCLILGSLFIPLAQALPVLIVSVTLLSIGGITISIPGVLIGDLTSRASLTRNMGVLRFISDFGIFAGPVTLSSLVDHFGYGVPVIADAVLLAISTASVLLLLPSRPIRAASQPGTK